MFGSSKRKARNAASHKNGPDSSGCAEWPPDAAAGLARELVDGIQDVACTLVVARGDSTHGIGSALHKQPITPSLHNRAAGP